MVGVIVASLPDGLLNMKGILLGSLKPLNGPDVASNFLRLSPNRAGQGHVNAILYL